jgi:RNA polymerase-interacting CarD/CdnL/TRCF family regulator
MSANPQRMADALLGLQASPGARSFGERKMAEQLEEQLYGELAAVLGVTVDEVRGQGISVAASA